MAPAYISIVPMATISGNIFVADHRFPAIGAENEPFQNVRGSAQTGIFAAFFMMLCAAILPHFLDDTEGFFVNDSLMGIGNNDPLRLRNTAVLPGG